MNRIKLFIGLLLYMIPLGLRAQNLSLEECIQEARSNYPAIRQYGLIEESRDYTIDNASRGWLPQVSFSAGGYGFTDPITTVFPEQSIGLSLKNGLVSGSISINQPIYDGGKIASRKAVAHAQAEAGKRQVDVTLYAVEDRVEQLYFSLLLLEEQIKQTSVLQEDLLLSQKTIESMARNGIANEMDREMIEVEILKVGQQLDQLASSRKAYLQMLEIFINRELNDSIRLDKPIKENLRMNNERPELAWYASRLQVLDKQRNQLNVRLHPTLSAFGTGLLHSQVSNLINNGMLLGGISLSWNIGALYTRKNDLRLLHLQEQQVMNEQEIFLFQNQIQEKKSRGALDALQKQLRRDDEIIRLRESIRSRSEKRVELGTESVNDMLRNIHAVSQARLEKSRHEIQLLQELYHLKHLQTH